MHKLNYIDNKYASIFIIGVGLGPVKLSNCDKDPERKIIIYRYHNLCMGWTHGWQCDSSAFRSVGLSICLSVRAHNWNNIAQIDFWRKQFRTWEGVYPLWWSTSGFGLICRDIKSALWWKACAMTSTVCHSEQGSAISHCLVVSWFAALHKQRMGGFGKRQDFPNYQPIDGGGDMSRGGGR